MSIASWCVFPPRAGGADLISTTQALRILGVGIFVSRRGRTVETLLVNREGYCPVGRNSRGAC